MNKPKPVATTNSGHPVDERAAFFDQQTGAFFRRVDWTAFGTVLAIAFSLYLYTLAPAVTLEDSGELTVAADHMGVPHPPGYPTWTLLAWFFQWIFHGIRYNGYPNPAWAVALMSATFASLACALLALLVSRSGADMMRGMKKATQELGLSIESSICWTAGVAAGLLLAFSPVLWSQAVIVEVYALNAFFLMMILVLTYRWMSRPGEDRVLYAMAYMFGLALTNHHTIFFIAPALWLAVLFRDTRLFRDSTAILGVLFAALLFYRAHGMTTAGELPTIKQSLYYVFGFLLLLTPLVLFLIWHKLFTEWRRLGLIALFALLGLSFYLYMPIASEQNPPHNWGYTRTWEGFVHAFTRGQYERIQFANPFADPINFFAQTRAYFVSLRAQFTLPTVLLAVLPFFFFMQIRRTMRAWLIILLIVYFLMSVTLMMALNPVLDIQTLFIQRRFFIPSHAIYAVWLGYSIIFALFLLEMWLRKTGITRYLGLGLAAILPLTILAQNFYNEDQIRIIGGAEQRGHDFGWQFGHWQLRGANAILEELDPDEPPLPNPDYPPEMEPDAIFFGGTDPGRFVPTYMIFSARCRPDIFLITQNALADNTYMAVMRDLYGDDIWIPSQQDSNRAFQEYVQKVQAGEIPPGAEVVVQDGRVSVQGVAGVMMINGILCRQIFDANKDRHPFYVEESYVIPWMYPYLEPHGLILKLNPEPIEITPEIVKNDRDFWDWYTARLLGSRRFQRDIVARKTFSKLRSAIAGIYQYRGLFSEAEHAFKQAIDLYPLSPEACFRLADMYLQHRRYVEAYEIISDLLKDDPGNVRVAQFLDQIQHAKHMDGRRQELEEQRAAGQMDLNSALELAQVYQQLQLRGPFEQHTRGLLQQDLPPQAYLQIGQLYANAQRLDLLEVALKRYLDREHRNFNIWVELSAVQAALQKPEESIQSLRRGVEIGGETVRDMARRDHRFDGIRNHPEFRRLVPAPTAEPTFRLPFQGF